jgi:signal transduction histidine kinase
MKFKISTGLKRVLGRDLITDNEVAIFELVKNSFDAEASHVYLYFNDDCIIIADNGNGMTKSDLDNKWLFVAYSSKRASKQVKDDYRDDIEERQHYAGSKGIGRFSSDRLGDQLTLQTRSRGSDEKIHSIEVDWKLFDQDENTEFQNIEIAYTAQKNFNYPQEIPEIKHGTVIKIDGLHEKWNRIAIKKLRAKLSKLINPFGSETDKFKVCMIVPSEEEADKREMEKSSEDEDSTFKDVINGEVKNFIFSTLREKTTFIEVHITDDGHWIDTKLTDRGELVYHIQEPNRYSLISQVNFNCQIFFLNTSAKQTFAKRVGLPSVQFGSVFLFRNGFRVFPIGEEDDDWFGMNRRKQQGYARFLGTRDVIGRIDVTGGGDAFEESSSRNQGLIDNPSVTELKDCFWEYCLKRLEKYVVPVTWADRLDKDTSDLSRLKTDGGKARVSSALAMLIDNDDVKLLDYSHELINIIDDRSKDFENSVISLKAVAEKAKDKELLLRITNAERQFLELKKSQANAQRIADEERKKKLEAQARVAAVEKVVEEVRVELLEERKRNSFLASVTSLDTETILNLHHQITIYAADINQQIQNFLKKITNQTTVQKEDISARLERLSFLNQKILAISKFATKANFRLESEAIEGDLARYLVEYVEEVAREFATGGIIIDVSSDNKIANTRFKPMDIAIMIDNLVSNSRRARASQIKFVISQYQSGILQITVSDDGRGFDKKISDPARIFEKGFTTTSGSGLGLYHVQKVINSMDGSIEIVSSPDQRGASFLIKVST